MFTRPYLGSSRGTQRQDHRNQYRPGRRQSNGYAYEGHSRRGRATERDRDHYQEHQQPRHQRRSRSRATPLVDPEDIYATYSRKSDAYARLFECFNVERKAHGLAFALKGNAFDKALRRNEQSDYFYELESLHGHLKKAWTKLAKMLARLREEIDGDQVVSINIRVAV